MNRRHMLLQASLLASGAAATAPFTSARADEGARDDRGRETVFLFIHGAWHAATHWNRVTLLLSELGFSTLAVDLPGSGLNAGYPLSYLTDNFAVLPTEVSPVSNITLTNYVD